MELTYIGLIQIVIGIYIVLFGGVRSAIFFLIFSSIFQGSAAISLPALGGSSIPPGHFALLFIALRVLAPKGGYIGYLPDAVADNKWLFFFAFYGMANAYIGPRIFSEVINVYPMSPKGDFGLIDTVPLVPTPQNLTAGIYLLGALLLGLLSSTFCRRAGAGAAMIGALIAVSWLHIISGIADLLTRGTPAAEILSFIRNGNYTLMDNSESGFIRIIGFLPEASVYAGIGFTLFVANSEMWYRSIRNRATGATAVCLALMLIISTSSSAYVALAGYGLFFVFRAIMFPLVAPPGKLMTSAKAFAGVIFILSVTQAIVPELTTEIAKLISDMTLAKPETSSGQQRLFWALQGWHAFFDSYGLGIGPGSFRSSSLVTAILGSVGFLGSAAFLIYLARVFEWTKRSSWGTGPTPRETLAGALGSAALISLIPEAILAPHAVPSGFFSILAGAAIGLRRQAPVLDPAQFDIGANRPDPAASAVPHGRLKPMRGNGNPLMETIEP